MCHLCEAGVYKALVSKRSRTGYNKRMHLSLECQVDISLVKYKQKANLADATIALLCQHIEQPALLIVFDP